MTARWRLYAALLALLLGSAPAFPRAVQAQGDKAAAALAAFKQGRSLFRAGQYQAAIEALRRSLTLKAHRNTLYYLGASYRRLGAFRQAFVFYRSYAKQFPQPRSAAMLTRYEKQLRWAPPCLLTVRSTPLGASARLDGRLLGRVGRGGLSRTIGGGTHRLEISKNGHTSQVHVIVAEYGEPLVRVVPLVASATKASDTWQVPLRRRRRSASVRKLPRPSLTPWSLEFGAGQTFASIHIPQKDGLDYHDLTGGAEITVALHFGMVPSRSWRWYGTVEGFWSLMDDIYFTFGAGGGVSRRIVGSWRVDLRLLAGGLFALGLDQGHPLARDSTPKTTVVNDDVAVLFAASVVAAFEWQLSHRWVIRTPLRMVFSPVDDRFYSDTRLLWIFSTGIALRWHL